MKYFFYLILIIMYGCGAAPTYYTKGLDISNAKYYATIITESENNHTGTFAFKGLDKRIYISKIDGVETKNISFDPAYPQKAHVAFGKHKIGVLFKHLGSYATGCIEFQAEAGETYIVRRELANYTVSFWLENTKSKQIVGNLCGFGQDS